MPGNKFADFHSKFLQCWNMKNYFAIVDGIPELLVLKYGKRNEYQYKQMCAFSIDALRVDRLTDISHVKSLLMKFKHFIDCSESALEALENFICMEYVSELSSKYSLTLGSSFPGMVDRTMINDMATVVLNNIQRNGITPSEDNRRIFKKFIVVLVQMESLLEQSQQKFAMTRKAIEYFSCNLTTTEGKKCGWPEYILCLLQIVELSRDMDADNESYELLQKVRNLVQDKNELRKDIAIMISLVINACSSSISFGSVKFMENILAILGQIYDIVRDKSASNGEYMLLKTFYVQKCCDKTNSHIALQGLGAVREIFQRAVDRNVFSEKLVSACSNYMVVESEILEYLNCSNRSDLIYYFGISAESIFARIARINSLAGHERADRTLYRLLSMKILHSGFRHRIISKLIARNETADDKTEFINAHVMKILLGEGTKSEIHSIHKLQKDLQDTNKFEIISSIARKLPKIKIDLVYLQFMQIRVEIEYPLFNEAFRQKMITDVCETDFYKNDRSSILNLVKSGVCYLQSMVHIERYKSNVVAKDTYGPLNEDFVLLNNEIEVVKQLRESLNYLVKFFQCKDLWILDERKDVYIEYMEKMTKRIGVDLISRHYKDLAVRAFDLLYRLAEPGTSRFKVTRIQAAGYLIENIDQQSTISEEEIVKDLQSKIISELKYVDVMASTSKDDFGDFLLSFLQLTMYTLRYQHKMEHAKKYMQAINKLLCKYDRSQQNYIAVRLKYSEVMFEMIVRDKETSITPITFIEDIFHRFQKIQCVSRSDFITVPGILFDLISTLHAFTQPRYEFRQAKSIIWYAHLSSLRKGYLLLFAKTTILTSSECLVTCGKHLEDHMKHLDVLFQCKIEDVRNEEVPTITWNQEITAFIHPENCTCFQCSNKFLNLLNMEVAAVKAWGVYYNKDFPKSLQSYQQIYDHWTATNASSYSSMLMNYSNCLISTCHMDKSKSILNQALDACNDSAQAQDISFRLLANKVKEGLAIDETPSYVNESRPKAVVTRQKASNAKKATNCKPGLLDDLKKEVKPFTRRNLRN